MYIRTIIMWEVMKYIMNAAHETIETQRQIATPLSLPFICELRWVSIVSCAAFIMYFITSHIIIVLIYMIIPLRNGNVLAIPDWMKLRNLKCKQPKNLIEWTVWVKP